MEVVNAFALPHFPRLAAAMMGRLDEVTDALLERSRRELPDVWDVDESLQPAIVEYARESIRAELACLREGGRLPDAMPGADVDGTRQTAQLGFPLSNLLWGYRAGHAAQWAAWLDLVEQEDDLGPSERRALLEAGSDFFFAYADRLTGLVTDTYSVERERVLASQEQRRVQLVRELLEGTEVDAAELGYELAGEHLGLVASGPDAPAVVRELAHRADRLLLLVPAVGDVWWAWLGGHRPMGEGGLRAVARVAPPEGTQLAVGLPEAGPAGFRATHEQAIAARGASGGGGARVVRFDDVALEVLAGADREAARAFAVRELEGLGAGDARSRRLRETLVAYFAANHNAAAAAAALGVHEQTVAARLRAVEERTGRPVGERRAELEIALRLERLLG